MQVEIRVLGPLEVVAQGESLRIAGRRERAILTLLAVRVGRTVSVDDLIEILWGIDPPADPDNAIRTFVSRLRTALRQPRETVVLEATGRGIRLVGDELNFDWQQVERLAGTAAGAAARGEMDAAHCDFTAALALWRGPPLVDLGDNPAAQAEIVRFTELREQLLEELVETEMALGHHHSAVAKIEGMVAAQPLRERRWAQLMLALYRSGRQAEALRAYQRLRSCLADELGVDPSAQLTALEDAMIQQKPELDWHLPMPSFDTKEVASGDKRRRYLATTTNVPTQAEPPVMRSAATTQVRPPFPAVIASTDTLHLVGRAQELLRLQRVWDEASNGGRRLVWLVGDAGIGKTRLAAEFAQGVFDHGAVVLYGRCDDQVGEPYKPIAEALRQLVGPGPPEVLAALNQRDVGELSRLLPDLIDRLILAPPPVEAEPQVRRHRLFQAVDALLSASSQHNPLLIILDDLHLADQPTLLLLRHLMRSANPAVISIIAIFRDSDISQSHPLLGLVADLAGETTAQRVSLTGLSEDAVRLFVHGSGIGATLSEEQQLGSLLWNQTDGNPFFIRELLRHLYETGRLDAADAKAFKGALRGRIEVPPTVRDVITWRAGRLAADSRLALEAAAVIGRDFDIDLIAKITQTPDAELLGALEAATRARLINEIPHAPGQFSFAHALTRQAIYESLSGLRRARLHLQVGRLLEQLPESELQQRLGEIAHHFFEAPRPDRAPAIDYSRRAGERALAQFAYEDAVGHFERAAAAVRNMPSNYDVLCSIQLALGEALWSSGNRVSAKDVYYDASHLARTLGDPSRLAAAAIGLCTVEYERGMTDDEVLLLAQESLERLGPDATPMRARTLAAYALAAAWTDKPPSMQTISNQAVDTGRASGDPVALAKALSADFLAHYGRQPLRCAEIARESVDIARASGDLSARAEGHVQSLLSGLEMRDRVGALEALAALQRFTTESRQPLYRWYSLNWEATWAIMEGRFDEGERLAASAINVGYAVRGPDAATAFVAIVSPIRWAQGRIAELIPGMDAYVDQYPAIHGWDASRLWVHAVAGNVEWARAELIRLTADGIDRFDGNIYALSAFAFLAHSCTILGEERFADELYRRMLSSHDYQVVIAMWLAGGVVSGVVPFYLGGLAALVGEWELAYRHFEDAITAHKALGSKPWEGWTYLRYGTAILARNSRASTAHGLHLLREAVAIAEETGMPHLKSEAERASR